MKKLAALSLLLFISIQIFAQQNLDRQKLLCKTWKIKKVIIDDRKAKQKVINDHISFGKDMKYISYDSEDVNFISSKNGQWKLNPDGTTLVIDPYTNKELVMKIIKLKEDIFVYELTFNQATWQVYLKPD